MDKTILITGGAGLVGSECCKLFSEEGWNVVSVDNYMRGKIFGKEGNTEDNISKLIKEYNKLMEYLPTFGIALATYVDDPYSITYYADPTKPKEYLACGLPIIITKVPWIAEEIGKEPMGIAINYNKEELITAIIKLSTDDNFYELCRENAIKFTKDLNWDTIFDEAFSKVIK